MLLRLARFEWQLFQIDSTQRIAVFATDKKFLLITDKLSRNVTWEGLKFESAFHSKQFRFPSFRSCVFWIRARITKMTRLINIRHHRSDISESRINDGSSVEAASARIFAPRKRERWSDWHNLSNVSFRNDRAMSLRKKREGRRAT